MRRGMAILVALCTLLAACGEEEREPLGPRPVRALKIGDLGVFAGRTFPGKAEPAEQVNLSFRVGGPLIERPVDVGTKVAKGDLLARIDPQDYEVALESAEARLDQARADLTQLRAGAREETIRALESKVRAANAAWSLAVTEEQRHKKLLDEQVISQSEYDAVRLRMDVAKEELDAAKENLQRSQVARPEVIQAKEAEIRSLAAAARHAHNELTYTELRAPFAGEISAMFVENYQTVQAKQPVCRLLDTSHVEFTFHVPEVLVSYVDEVGDLRVTFDALPDVHLPATVKHVRGEATQRTRTYPVTLTMEQPEGRRILPGMAGEARAGRPPAAPTASTGVEIPAAAVFTDSTGKQLVWVIDPSSKTVAKREVHPEGMASTGIRVTEVAEGDWIAIAGVHSLEEGDEVRILDEATGEELP